jgi:hypothetical protein
LGRLGRLHARNMLSKGEFTLGVKAVDHDGKDRPAAPKAAIFATKIYRNLAFVIGAQVVSDPELFSQDPSGRLCHARVTGGTTRGDSCWRVIMHTRK